MGKGPSLDDDGAEATAATVAGKLRDTTIADREAIDCSGDTGASLIPQELEFAARYAVGNVIGQGGMGVVAECRDAVVHRDVAIKIDEKQSAGGLRFLREARLQGQLEHPGVVPIYDLGTTDSGQSYFTMQRVRGQTFKALLAEPNEVYPLRRALGDFGRVCDALAFAHERGVVHRDIKPSNIMIGDHGAVYLIDWGIAKLIGASTETEVEVDEPLGSSELTVTGSTLGTPAFMSPEQRRGISNEKSDQYSLGVVLSHIIRREQKPQPELHEVVKRATQEDPEERFPSVAALHEVIEGYLAGNRDMQRRREIADDCLEQTERFLRGTASSIEGYKQAMRKVGHALALAPDHPRAARAFVRLMERKLDQVPVEVATALENSRSQARAKNCERVALACCGTFVPVPIFVWAGLRSWLPLALSVMLWGIAIAITGLTARKPSVHPAQMVPPLLAVNLANAGLALIVGWFVFLPSFVIMTSVSFAFYMGRARRWLVAASGSLAVVLPAALLSFDVLPAVALAGDGLPFLSLVAGLAWQLRAAMVFAIVCMIMVATYYFGSVGDALEDAELELLTRSWQTRNLAPSL